MIDDDPRARRAVAIVSFVAAALVMLHGVLWDAVRYEDGRFLARSGDLVTVGADKADLFRWSLVCDLLGSYLLLIPAAVWLWRALRPAGGVVIDVASAAGLVYAAAGAVVAAVLAAGGEPLIRAFAETTGPQRFQVALVFTTLIDSVVGVWQLAGSLAAGVWWIGVGAAARRKWRGFGSFSIVLGTVVALGAAGRVLGLEYESSAPATLAFSPIAIWAGWLGVRVWRDQPAVVNT